MKNCFVEKYNVAVDNDNLETFGVFDMVIPAGASNFLLVAQRYKEIRWEGNGVVKNASNIELTSPVTGITNLYVTATEDMHFEIDGKYSLTGVIQANGASDYSDYPRKVNLNSLRASTGLTQLWFEYNHDLTCDLDELTELVNVTYFDLIQGTALDYNVKGSIVSFSKWKALEKCYIQRNMNISGELETLVENQCSNFGGTSARQSGTLVINIQSTKATFAGKPISTYFGGSACCLVFTQTGCEVRKGTSSSGDLIATYTSANHQWVIE